MATTGATLIDALSRRLRDTSNTAHSRDLLKRILTHSQRAINLAQQAKKASVSFTPDPGRTIYTRTEVAANVGRILRIIADRTLPEVRWPMLQDTDRHWYRAIGGRHVQWARIGGNLFVLHPALWEPEAVTVIYVTVPADVIDGATNVDLPDELLPMVMDLAEGIMLAKARITHAMDAPLTRLAAALQPKAAKPLTET